MQVDNTKISAQYQMLSVFIYGIGNQKSWKNLDPENKK